MKDLLRVGMSNVIFMLLSVFISLFLPFYFTVEEFGYWQLFYYYTSFAGMIMLGFNDGIHLKYAGIKKEHLNTLPIKGYFLFNLIFSIIIVGFMLTLVLSSDNNIDRNIIFTLLGFQMVLFNLNSLFRHIYLISQQFKRFSIIKYSQRLLFVIFLLISIIFYDPTYYEVIIIFIISSFIILLSNLKTNWIYLSTTTSELKFLEIVDNFKRGFPLTSAAIISLLLITYPRLLVDYHLTIHEFSIFSLAYNFLSLSLTVILSLSIVLYPKLKQADKLRVKSKLNITLIMIAPVLILSLLSYFPIIILLNTFLTDYLEISNFIHFMLPMIYFQAIFNILLVNIFKIFDLEKSMLAINLIGLLLNIITTNFVFSFFKTLESVSVSSTISYMLFYIAVLLFLSKKIKWELDKFIIVFDMIIIILFVLIIEFSSFTTSVYLIILLFIFYSIVMFKRYKETYLKWRSRK